jgi:tetratricopeptide (TPR) repeat protein
LIDGEDEECNLGKGISLHYRGQSREAIEFLAKSTRLSESSGTANPSGHFFVALAIESERGIQEEALDHYRKAVEQDQDKSFTQLYQHLVDVLIVYSRIKRGELEWFLDRMLSYSGSGKEYWTRVKLFSEKLSSPADNPWADLGIFARAMAEARIGETDAAVKSALELVSKPNFKDRLERIFPTSARSPEYLYGKALTLFEAKRYEELEAFFEDEIFRLPDPVLLANDSFQKILALQGLNIMNRWRESSVPGAVLSTEAKIERDKTLGRARDDFEKYLDRFSNDYAIRRTLGEVQELMESFTAAFLSYELVARQDMKDSAVFQHIVKLHSGRLLTEKDLGVAWELLRKYKGDNPDIVAYVEKTRKSIKADIQLYCQGCGRKASEGDTTCLECGRQLTQVPPKPPLTEK